MEPSSMKLCMCKDFSKHIITLPNGNIQRGLLVYFSTRRKHWRTMTNELDEARLSSFLPTISCNDQEKHFRKEQHDCQKFGSDFEKDESNPEAEHSMKESEIAYLVLEYIMWLNLDCGISPQNSQKAHNQLIRILDASYQPKGIESTLTKLIPHDI
ncbi:hypothetical protein O181_070388 [Austropuccinia psidii MF-1]|uniref:Uncharacterized protein n=1 Tax=Austropuccinia psidii MF-1 TaxID=1389203 RepID=A0A9Q3EZ06_9BASI|nr:hypothetical protein [Austropuccinia psidii MF-1]